MTRPKDTWRASPSCRALLLLLVLAAGCAEPSGAVDETSSETKTANESDRNRDSRNSKVDPRKADEADDEIWMTIRIGDQRVGYGHITSREVERDGRTLVLGEDLSQITMQRFGQSITMQVETRTLETPEGDLLELWSTTRNPPADPSRTHAVVDGDELRLEVETAGRTTTRTIPWKPGTKSPNYDWNLDDDPPRKGETRTGNVFLPELNQVAETTLTAEGSERLEGIDGPVSKYVVRSNVVPGATTLFVDERGDAVLTRVDLLGTTMEMETVDRETALAQIEGTELDLAIETLIDVEPIPNAHRTKRAVYRVHAEGDDPTRFFGEGGTQSIRRIDDETIEVTVTAAAFPEQPSDETVGGEYTAPSPFLQSEDRRVVEHAKKAAGDSTARAEVARKLEAYVRDVIKSKNFSTAMASAAEVAERLEGDCTEHAVLLAAMLRARGIPSRIVVGFVYSAKETAFAGHMWTEAFVDGEWVPLDGTLGRGGTAAAHLKLADSAFADDTGHPIAAFLPVLESIGKLRIQVVESE